MKTESVIFNEGVKGREALCPLRDRRAVVAASMPYQGSHDVGLGAQRRTPGNLVVTDFAGTINKHSKGRGERRRNLITHLPSALREPEVEQHRELHLPERRKTAAEQGSCKPDYG